jgi:hypothetical protein
LFALRRRVSDIGAIGKRGALGEIADTELQAAIVLGEPKRYPLGHQTARDLAELNFPANLLWKSFG